MAYRSFWRRYEARDSRPSATSCEVQAEVWGRRGFEEIVARAFLLRFGYRFSETVLGAEVFRWGAAPDIGNSLCGSFVN